MSSEDSKDILFYITENVDLSKRMEKEIRLALIKREIDIQFPQKNTKERNEIYKTRLTHLNSDGTQKKFTPKVNSRSRKSKKSTKKSLKKSN